MSENTHTHFSQPLLNWFKEHGRHDLPWQHPREPYRVWLSEIMLQQTQVQTVIPYFERFTQAFPTITALANASQDEVLHHWTGLGYYARARNLHKAAQQIQNEHGGQFPDEYENILALPGIGPSTAAAIIAQAYNQPHAILDGNVKRVLTRYHAISGWPGEKKIENQLWKITRLHTPNHSAADYTQAIMDLGAILCKRSKPLCESCPIRRHCLAKRQGNPQDYPTSKKRSKLPIRQTVMLLLENKKGEVLLQQRPASGIWGGLWSLPEVESATAAEQAVQQLTGFSPESTTTLDNFRHTFSHFHLDIEALHCKVSINSHSVMDSDSLVWYKGQPASTPQTSGITNKLGLPAPVKLLLENLMENQK